MTGFEKMTGPFGFRTCSPDEAAVWQLLVCTLYDAREQVEVLVDVNAYTGASSLVNGFDMHWCPLDSLAAGTAAVYPCKVQVPGKGVGQFAWREIRGVRYADHDEPPFTAGDRHPRNDMNTRSEA